MGTTTLRSEHREGASRWTALLMILVLVAGCGGASSGGTSGGGGAGVGFDGGNGQAISDPTTVAPVDLGAGLVPETPASVDDISDAELEAIIDEIVTDAEAEIEPAVTGANAAPMPPSLDDYFDIRDVETWKLALDSPLVASTCKIAKLPKVGTILEAAIGLLIQRLRVRQSVKGLAKVVTAASLGCKYLVTPLSEMIQKEDVIPLPTPAPESTDTPIFSTPTPPVISTPPLPSIYQAQVGEYVPIRDATTEYGRIMLVGLSCIPSLGNYSPGAGYRFLAAHVRVDAAVDGIPFDTYYWEIESDHISGVLVPNDDPRYPAFGYGRLAAGYTQSGWIVHSVLEPQGSITVRYRGNPYSPEPWFEVQFLPCPPS